jgi:hypothetical protein
MGSIRNAAILLTLLVLPRAGGAAAPAVGARQLARTVDAALAGIAQAASAPKEGLDTRNPRNASFLAALQSFRVRVGQIEGALAPRSVEFFLLVDQGSSDLGELRVAWARSGARNDRISAGLRTASSSYRQLRADYGREGLRRRQGGVLSDAEKQQFQRLQGAEQRFAASLQPLRDQVRRKGDATTAAELERFRAEAESLAVAAADLSTYLNALIATSELRGEWHANAPYIRKAAAPAEVAVADDTVQDLYVDSDIGQVFTVDLGSVPAEGAEVTAAGGTAGAAGATAGAVEVYQAAAEGPTEVVVAEPVVELLDDPAASVDPAAPQGAPTAATTDAGGGAVIEPITETAESTEAPETTETGPDVAAPAEGSNVPKKPAAKDPKKKVAPPAVPPPAPPPIG